MNEIPEEIKLINAKLDSILSLLDILVRKSDLVNDNDDDEISDAGLNQTVNLRSIRKELSLKKDINR